jgi:hypothetical protein
MTTLVKFQVGQTYNMSLRGYDMGVAEITKRTDKSVWLKHEDGVTKRYKINILDEKEIVQAKNLFTISATNITKPQDTLEPVTKPQDLETFNHFEYIESHYVVKNPPGSENIYTEVPGGWTNLKSVAFTLITAWENGCLDMTVQHWITGLTRDELDTLLSVLVSMFSHAKIKSGEVNQIILGLMPTNVIVSSETPIDDETYAGILKAFDLDIYCGESVKQGHREYFAPVPRFDIEPDMYFIVSANVGEEYDTIFSVKKLNQALTTPSVPDNVIEVDFSARRRKA